jgi:hypothetical protein
MAPANRMPARTLVGWEQTDPLGDVMVDYLLSRKYEASEFDFKEIISTGRNSDFAKVAKDIFAMSNYGGGYLLLGFRQRPTGGYDPVGLPPEFHVDQAELQEKFNSYASSPLAIGYLELERDIEGGARKFAIIYVPPPTAVLRPTKDGVYTDGRGRTHFAFKAGITLIRRGTQSIVATPEEILLAERRVKQADYSISLISGQPDEIEELVYSDLFEILSLPEFVYASKLAGEIPEIWRPDLSAWIVHGADITSFDNPERSSLRDSLIPGSTECHRLADLSVTSEGNRAIIELLRWELIATAHSVGIQHDGRRDRLFYTLEPGHDRRRVRWQGLTRSAERTVASRRYVAALHRDVVLHLCFTPRFRQIAGAYLLRLEPGFLLSEDGYNPLYGPKQGAVLTSLENSVVNFNLGYLRSVLFWANQLRGRNEKICLRTDLVVNPTPASLALNFGILSDKASLSSVTGETPLRPDKEEL